MKIAIFKIGANITWSPSIKTATTADIDYFIRSFREEHEITIITKFTRNTVKPKDLSHVKIADYQEDIDINKFDIVLVFNGAINFWGGAEDAQIIGQYRYFSKFDGPIVYCQTDGAMWFSELWPKIMGREWAEKYRDNTEQFNVNLNKIFYLSQARDGKKVRIKSRIDQEHIYHYPFEESILFARKGVSQVSYEMRIIDLMYGGASRNSYRMNRLKHFYTKHENLSVEIFGAVKPFDNVHIKFTSKVSNKDFITKMSRARATCIVGDEWYENNMFTLRMYESMLAGALVFIDEKFDSNHEFYRDEFLKEMLYVRNGIELRDKLSNINESDFFRIRKLVHQEKIHRTPMHGDLPLKAIYHQYQEEASGEH